MRQIKGKDGTVREYHMSAGKGMRLNQKFGRSIFSINSDEGLMQIAGSILQADILCLWNFLA